MGMPRDRSPRNHRVHRHIVQNEPRCIYCANTRETAKITLEHMPPISMFRDRQRLKGMEYATCQPCNNGTKGADVTAAFMARIGPETPEESWQVRENRKYLSGLTQSAPGVVEELFDERKAERVYLRGAGGILVPKVRAQANGPMVRGYMNIFAAKLAMALYREHVGVALPLEGRIETIVFFNAGLAQQTADTMLEIMPNRATLTMGERNVGDQFAYRFNTDGREIVAALVGFHGNLHIMAMAASNPIYEGLESPPFANKCRPGQLLEMIPKKQPLILPGLPGSKSALT